MAGVSGDIFLHEANAVTFTVVEGKLGVAQHMYSCEGNLDALSIASPGEQQNVVIGGVLSFGAGVTSSVFFPFFKACILKGLLEGGFVGGTGCKGELFFLELRSALAATTSAAFFCPHCGASVPPPLVIASCDDSPRTAWNAAFMSAMPVDLLEIAFVSS